MIEPVTATVIVSLLVCEAVKEGGKYLSKSPRDTFTQLVNTIREKFKTEGTEGLLTRTLNQPTEVNNANLQRELQTQIDADSEFANKLTQLVKQLQAQDKNIDDFVKQNIYNVNKEIYKQKIEEIYEKNGYPLESKYRRELKDLQDRLRLSDDDAKLIEEPKQKELVDLNKEKYKQKITEIYNKKGHPLDEISLKELKKIQNNLGLADDDVKLIEEPVKSKFYNFNKNKYEKKIKYLYKRHGYPLGSEHREELELFKKKLGLSDNDVKLIEDPIEHELYNSNKTRYKQKVIQVYNYKGYPLESHAREELNFYQQELVILDDDAIAIEEPIKNKYYNLNKKYYEQQVTNLYNSNGYPLKEEHRQELNVLQDKLALLHDDAITIEEPIKKKFHELNKGKYSKLVSDLYKENGYPLEDKHHQELNAYWYKLGLVYDDAQLIQRPIEEYYYKVNIHKYSGIIEEYQNHNSHSNLINFEQFQVLRESLGLEDEDTILIEKLIKKYKYFGIIFRHSESEIDYWKLRNLLIEERWKEANQETKNLILQLADRQKQGYVKHNFLQSIEERDMFIIDQLWLIYSDKRFGFTVQAGIFDNANYDEELFAERVGWKRNTNGLLKIFSWKSYEELNFEQNAPVGHLPTWGFQRRNFINNKYYCIFWFYICRLFKLEDSLKWIFLSKYFKRLDYLE
jgi:hypothetical protein